MSSLLGLPARVLIRKCRSSRIQLAGISVYVVECGENKHSGYSLLQDALNLVQTGSPFLWSLLSRLRCVMLIDTVPLTAYYQVESCCCLNPWNIRRHINCPIDRAMVMAGGLVYALVIARIVSRRCRKIEFLYRERLAADTSVRFLRRVSNDSSERVIRAMTNLIAN